MPSAVDSRAGPLPTCLVGNDDEDDDGDMDFEATLVSEGEADVDDDEEEDDDDAVLSNSWNRCRHISYSSVVVVVELQRE